MGAAISGDPFQLVGWWEASFVAKALADVRAPGCIHVQDLDGDFATSGLSDKYAALIAKVTLPDLSPWVEKRNDLAVKHSRQIGSLGGIALWTRETQIDLFIAPAMLTGNDVLDMKREEVEIVLMNATILTAGVGAAPHELSCRDVNHHLSEELARSCRAFDLSRATNVP
jgi:hypothetical protein